MADLQEREARQEAVGHETDVFQLNEGCCPTCKGDAEIVHMGGITKFFEQYTYQDTDDVPKAHWAERPEDDLFIIGSIEWRCEDGHKHYVEVDRHGDWH